MNYFEAQDRSRKTTRQLVLAMLLAVVCVATSVAVIVTIALWSATATSSITAGIGLADWLSANPQVPLWATFYTAGFIGLASLYRVIRLRQGGGHVARELGGTLVDGGQTDPLRRRLRNVVEEISIASGVPVPEIYVLEHEPSINAFAAGFSPDDAAVAVTRGTLEYLNRDELQGVIAHEFSHILNGDMRLNIRLMGPLFGVLAIGLLGRMVLRSVRLGARRSSRNNAVPVVMVLGVGLTAVGFVGLLAGRLIKAAVSRQREYLADASAVQFTRQRDGIAGALKKIGGLQAGSALQNTDSEEVSHMLFASGFASISSWFATHPPLLKRIQAIDPRFDAAQFTQLTAPANQVEAGMDLPGVTAGLSGTASGKPATTPLDVVNSVGNPGEAEYELARDLYQVIPATISAALESEYDALLLVPALLLHSDPEQQAAQRTLLQQQLGAERLARVRELYGALGELDAEIRLPLMELALPRLRRQPLPRLEYMQNLLNQLAASNQRVELFEYALLKMFSYYVAAVAAPRRARRWRGLDSPRIADAAVTLLRIFALHGTSAPADAARAFDNGMAALGVVAEPGTLDAAAWQQETDAALDQLRDCTPQARARIVTALAAAALADHQVTQAESELLRCFCAILECPLPPFLPYRTR